MNPKIPERPNMEADDVLRCAGCGKKASHTGVFWTFRVDQAMVDHRAVERQTGLEMMIGSASVAAVMGDRKVVRRWPYGSGEAHVCNDCMPMTSVIEVIGAAEVQPEEDD